jgi:hypothetical protein
MAAFDRETLDRWRTLAIVDRDGTTVGTIEEFYLDRETGHPTWALVNTGLFGATKTFVPLVHATEISDGLQVPYEKGHIKDAPRVDPHDELTPEEEATLFTHYGVDYHPSSPQPTPPEPGIADPSAPDLSRPAPVEPGLPGSIPATGDPAMVTSGPGPVPATEEALTAGARPHPSAEPPPGPDSGTHGSVESLPRTGEEGRPAGATDLRFQEADPERDPHPPDQPEERSPLDRARHRLERLVPGDQAPTDPFPADRDAAERARRERLGLDDPDDLRDR